MNVIQKFLISEYYKKAFFYTTTKVAFFRAKYVTIKKADNGSRTRLSSLGSWRSTDEPYLHKKIITDINRKVKENI